MTQSYMVVFEKVADDNWGGWALDVPGAVGAGDTLADARKSLLEGIDIMLEDIAERGLEAPLAKSTYVEFSEFEPDPSKSQYVVEWLTVDLPQSFSHSHDTAQQAA